MPTLSRGVDWDFESLPRLMVVLPCKHKVEVRPEWILPDGRIPDRLSCTFPKCRQDFEGLVLEDWPAP